MKYDWYEEWCPVCGPKTSLRARKVNEYTDADGNRGMLVTYVECPKCGWELGDEIPESIEGEDE
ncbi:hypothetical protein [Brevibacillus agri]|uniref:hypothetical protein n=1 Tax=Brevibacillus agri TaxID=51101 RepID=UPI001EE62C11|nr:hypothetical protein [Brevibacillus agri]MCG5252604.1 hypothetical protein [Brevibacillus agri]